MRSGLLLALTAITVGVTFVVLDRIEQSEIQPVREALLDGRRAIFSDVRKSPGGATCGIVNAPNRFGGMAGRQRFIVLQSREVILEERVGRDQMDGLDGLAGCER